MTLLPTLAQTLTLPTGWTFSTQTLTDQLNLVTGGTAYVINDNLVNSYRGEPRKPPPDRRIEQT